MDSRVFFVLILLVIITNAININDIGRSTTISEEEDLEIEHQRQQLKKPSVKTIIGGSTSISEEEDLEIEHQLQQLKKPSVKTIKTAIGDIYDCVHIQNQPAMDNPLLKDHKVKMQPSSSFVGRKRVQKTQRQKRIRIEDQILTLNCPTGTVPIRRVGKEDLVREKLFLKSYTSSAHQLTLGAPGLHASIIRSKTDVGTRITGIEATMSVHKLDIGPDQYSSTQIQLEQGSNVLQTGIMISPLLYGNSRTRLFGFWETMNDGCFNIRCSGFVQVSKKVPIDGYFINTTEIGKQVWTTELTLEKDHDSFDWWITISGIKVGYWPHQILYDLYGSGASYYHWGGVVKGSAGEPSPPMGNGHTTPLKFGYVGYVRGLRTMDQDGDWQDPDMILTENFNDCPGSYILKYIGDDGPGFGHTFFYGGPGGKCGA